MMTVFLVAMAVTVLVDLVSMAWVRAMRMRLDAMSKRLDIASDRVAVAQELIDIHQKALGSVLDSMGEIVPRLIACEQAKVERDARLN